MNHKLLYFALRLTLIVWFVAAAASLWFNYAEAAPPIKVTICHPPNTLELPATVAAKHLEDHPADYLGPCAESTPTGTPSPEPTDTPTPPPTLPPTETPTPAPDDTPSPATPTETATVPPGASGSYSKATGLLWLLTDGNQHCLLFAESHPSIERQNARCMPDWFNGSWVATNAPCAQPVYSRWPGDAEGFWPCDRFSPWRLSLSTLKVIYERRLARSG